MEERQLGRTGVRVSSIGLGTLTWARDTDAETAATLLSDFASAGGTLVDTAASYADGQAEELIGSLLDTVVPREDLVLCTKGGLRRTPQGPVVDSSRRALLSSIDGSLRRLGTDHVDLFLVQQPDHRTSNEEVAATLQHIVDTGRARYVGLSNHPGWRTARIGTMLGPFGLGAVEVEYSLVHRDAEAEVLPAAADLGAGVLAWSPLGRGVLTGKYRRTVPADSRAASAHLAGFVAPYLTRPAGAVVEGLVTAAAGLDRSPLEVALAWLLSAPISSAIVGARTPAQLAPVLDLDPGLPDEIRAALDEVSAPVPR
ncbi:aldo/keto reductase [Actinotalea sp.]|uniref:aldo/keto reductase n=1 Tax=Actinotalea sp. TaxID=1872145 RepID=UPI0035656612